MTLLRAERLRKSFGAIEAVADVSFTLDAGEMLALIGPNGAGKSTCFNLLNGQMRPDGGRVLLAGRDVTGAAPRQIWRLGVGRSFQVAAAFASMTVRENVQTALTSHHRGVWQFWQRAASLHRAEADVLLHQVGLQAQGDHAAGILAYGDVKRLELAMALANAPRLLLMDEPTAGMAPAERTTLMHLVRGLAQQRSMAVLFTEHDMDVVFASADRVLVMNRGSLIAEGPPRAIRADPDVQRVYLGEA